MSWLEDGLPPAIARPMGDDDVLEATLHVLAALAAGVAAMQLLMAVVAGELMPALFFAAALVATGASAFLGRSRLLRRPVFVVGGAASVLVWLALLPQPVGQPLVVFGMAAISALLTRQLIAGERKDSLTDDVRLPSVARRDAWIDEDTEGFLPA